MLKSEAFETALTQIVRLTTSLSLTFFLPASRPFLHELRSQSVPIVMAGSLVPTLNFCRIGRYRQVLQRSMHQAVGCDEVRSIEAGHSAYFFDPR